MTTGTMESPPAERVRVLVVDDDPDDLVLFKRMAGRLEGMQADVTSLTSYEAALTQIRSGHYDVHFVDYRLGTGTGLDLIAIALQEKPDGAFVVVSGQGSEQLATESKRGGAIAYMSKSKLSATALQRCISYCRSEAAQPAARSRRALGIFDGLTGLYVRSAFERAARHKLATRVSSHHQWALLYIEVDNFCLVLEDWGADVADQTLQAVAASLKTELTGQELVGRYSEDEFCVLAPCHGPLAAKQLAERFRASVEEKTDTTASVGVCIQPTHSASLETLVALAAQATRQAVEYGRNRVEVYDRP